MGRHVVFVVAFVCLSLNTLAQNVLVTFPGTQGQCLPATVQLQSTLPNTFDASWTLTPPAASACPVPPTEFGLTGLFTLNCSGGWTVNAQILLSNGSIVNGSATFSVYEPPVLHFTPDLPISYCGPLDVCFDASTTTGGTPPYNYIWDFCDGDSSNMVNPCHTYQTNGTYCLSLAVSDSYGCKADTTLPQFVTIGLTNAAVTLTPSSLYEPVSVTVNNTSTGASAYQWYILKDDEPFDTSELSNITDTVPNSVYHGLESGGCGTYTFILITKPDSNVECWDTVIHTINVLCSDVDFTASDTAAGCPPSPVQFTIQPSTLDTSAGWTTHWDLGDGHTSALPNPAHIYDLPGSYTVTLVVTDPNGYTVTVVKPNYITVGGPTASVSVSADSGCAPLCVSFVLDSTNATSFTWCSGQAGEPCVAGTNTFSYCYTVPDTMCASVLLCDAAGCCYEHPLACVYVDTAIAAFTVNQTSLCDSGVVQFTDQSHGITDAVEWLWSFGDNAYSVLQNPTHQYTDTGCYDVTLFVQTAAGCEDSVVKPNYVCVYPGVAASFSTTNPPTSCTSPYTVCFAADTVDVVGYNWSFGGWGNATGPTPCIAYNTEGSFGVSLTVTNQFGCADTLTLPGYVNIGSAVISVNGFDTVAAGSAVSFATSAAVSYNWSVTPAVGVSPVDATTNPFVVVFNQAGAYQVCVHAILGNGCTATACHMVVAIDSSDAVHNADGFSGFAVSSNPTDGNALVTFGAARAGDATLRISSVDGKLLKEQRVFATIGLNNLALDMQGLADGLYILTLSGGRMDARTKLVLQR